MDWLEVRLFDHFGVYVLDLLLWMKIAMRDAKGVLARGTEEISFHEQFEHFLPACY